MMDNNNKVPDAKPATMNVTTFASKFGTKGEIYRFLTVEAGVYLPHYQTVTIWHMKDLASGDKTVSQVHLLS